MQIPVRGGSMAVPGTERRQWGCIRNSSGKRCEPGLSGERQGCAEPGRPCEGLES